MRSNRYLTGTVLVFGALGLTLLALIYPVMKGVQSVSASTAASADINSGTVSTQFGPLTTLERDFITKVRLAGLWEGPAGQQGLAKGTTPEVKTAAQHLIDGHRDLDNVDRDVAVKLGVPLPSQPNAQQQSWLNEMAAATGTDYDRKMANILRFAHGQVFNLVAEIRSSTRNTEVRRLADQANVTVLDHITVLEKTGLVDFDSIAAQMAAIGKGGTPKPAATQTAVTAPEAALPAVPAGAAAGAATGAAAGAGVGTGVGAGVGATTGTGTTGAVVGTTPTYSMPPAAVAPSP